MQFRDLKRQYDALQSDIDKAIKKVINSSAFIMGKSVMELEEELAQYVGVRHCIACANGTDALVIALKVWGIGKGDAVFVPDFTFFASAEAVSAVGATPVFVDVCHDTFNINHSDLENRIIKTIADGELVPKAILSVDLFGLPANYTKLQMIAQKYRLLLLEDAAQGFGGYITETKACAFGDISTTSFFPAKPLGCYGDGGALFTNNDEWAALARSYRMHGKGSFKYDNVRIGMNSRLDTLQAAILRVKLKAFDAYELDAVNTVAKRYTSNLNGMVHTPVVPLGFGSSWAQYTIVLNEEQQRDNLQNTLKASSIPSMIYYPKPIHEQTAYNNIDCRGVDFPITEKLCKTVLSLPMHPYLTASEVDQVSEVVVNALSQIR
ncbi:MAG: DegT/DnrJ/EryC1/StrS family aminotransferase [Bacteroidales bacterium]|nr:DegT/DnrJ/EryC1/StrS family aminotransferase [Bacteroidales bacterium]